MADAALIEKHEAPVQVTSDATAMISMIERAARDPNVDIDKMERLFQMHERMMQQQAKTAYLSAFSELQSQMPAAIRSGRGHNGNYARYEDLIKVLRPVLSRNGFSISHRVNTDGNTIRVTGVLGHAAGHSEETQMVLPPDKSGGKTDVHAMASSISYGKRYVTLTLTGIATEGEDDDAARVSGVITDKQADELRKLITESETDIDAFLKHGNVESISDIAAAQFEKAKALLLTRKAKVMKDKANAAH